MLSSFRGNQSVLHIKKGQRAIIQNSRCLPNIYLAGRKDSAWRKTGSVHLEEDRSKFSHTGEDEDIGTNCHDIAETGLIGVNRSSLGDIVITAKRIEFRSCIQLFPALEIGKPAIEIAGLIRWSAFNCGSRNREYSQISVVLPALGDIQHVLSTIDSNPMRINHTLLEHIVIGKNTVTGG